MRLLQVTVLRIAAVILFTNFFQTVSQYLLIPVDCLLIYNDQYTSMSEYFRGPGAKCRPWGYPEGLVTFPALAILVRVWCAS